MSHDQIWGSALIVAALALFVVLAVAEQRKARREQGRREVAP